MAANQLANHLLESQRGCFQWLWQAAHERTNQLHTTHTQGVTRSLCVTRKIPQDSFALEGERIKGLDDQNIRDRAEKYFQFFFRLDVSQVFRRE